MLKVSAVAGQAAQNRVVSPATNRISLGGFAMEPAYQISFSQHYSSSCSLVLMLSQPRVIESYLCVHESISGWCRVELIVRCVWRSSRRQWSM